MGAVAERLGPTVKTLAAPPVPLRMRAQRPKHARERERLRLKMTESLFTHPLYVSPVLAANIDVLTASEGLWITTEARAALNVARETPTAFWVDSINAIAAAERILIAAQAQTPPSLCVFVLYNLPNRDCAAKASLGELCCAYLENGGCDWHASGTCSSGIRQYRDDFVRPFARALARNRDVPVAVIIEPDSIPNLITNMEHPHCGSNATASAIQQGVQSAVSVLGLQTDAWLYLDAGHGGWLGWDAHARRFLELVCSMGLGLHLRGFSTNVANYNPTGVPCPAAAFEGSETAAHYCNWIARDAACCLLDACGRRLLAEYNSGASELMYAQTLHKHARAVCPGFEPHFVIDTSRNGRRSSRDAAECHAWCNLRGSALGHVPSADTGLSSVDAFLWIKAPGESDGCRCASRRQECRARPAPPLAAITLPRRSPQSLTAVARCGRSMRSLARHDWRPLPANPSGRCPSRRSPSSVGLRWSILSDAHATDSRAHIRTATTRVCCARLLCRPCAFSSILPSGKRCARFDQDCGSNASIGSRPGEPAAPEAGQFFPSLMLHLATNATVGRLPSTRLVGQPSSRTLWMPTLASSAAMLSLGVLVGASLVLYLVRRRPLAVATLDLTRLAQSVSRTRLCLSSSHGSWRSAREEEETLASLGCGAAER